MRLRGLPEAPRRLLEPGHDLFGRPYDLHILLAEQLKQEFPQACLSIVGRLIDDPDADRNDVRVHSGS